MIELETDVDDIVRYYSKRSIYDSLRLAEHMLTLPNNTPETENYWLEQKAKLSLALDISLWYGEEMPIRIDLVVKGMWNELSELKGNYHWLTQQLVHRPKGKDEI